MHHIINHDDGGRGTLTEAIIDRVIANVPNVYLIKSVAVLADVSIEDLERWMKRGEKEYNDNLDTLYARLFHRYQSVKYTDSKEIVTKLKTCPRNYTALTFVLETCFRDEFAQKSDTMKMLEDIVFNKIAPMMNKDITHVEYIDHESETS